MKSTEEREKRTEKHTITTRETMVSRVKSPDRRYPPSHSADKTRTTDGRRSAETRTRDPRQDVPQQGMMHPFPDMCARMWLVVRRAVLLTWNRLSTLGT